MRRLTGDTLDTLRDGISLWSSSHGAGRVCAGFPSPAGACGTSAATRAGGEFMASATCETWGTSRAGARRTGQIFTRFHPDGQTSEAPATALRGSVQSFRAGEQDSQGAEGNKGIRHHSQQAKAGFC
jgi:hypothetical protein